jgi:hypothetical protein
MAEPPAGRSIEGRTDRASPRRGVVGVVVGDDLEVPMDLEGFREVTAPQVAAP